MTRVMRWVLGAMLAAVIGAVGCAYTDTNSVVTGPPQPPNQGGVRIVMEGGTAPAGFQEIALVQATGHGGNADMAHVIYGMQKEAQAHGCNIIIHVRVDQGSGEASGTGVCGVVR